MNKPGYHVLIGNCQNTLTELWMPTLTDLAGLPAPARTDGVSLVPTLLGVGTQQPSTIYVEYCDDLSATPEYPEFVPDHQGLVRNRNSR